MACCVGFVFCSPFTIGTSETCIWRKLFFPARLRSERMASMKGPLSMSPTVPPSSMMQTSGCSLVPSTGMRETRSIQSWMASVTCGTTCTVRPR